MPNTGRRKDEFHHIRVRLMPNNLPAIKGKYIARTSNEAFLNIEQVCASLRARGGFTGNYGDLVTHVKQFFDEAAYQLCDGFGIDTGYYSVYPVVGGTFKHAHEAPDRKKHPVKFRFRIQPPLAALTRRIVIEVKGEADTRGSIKTFTDFNTGGVNDRASPGGMFTLQGRRLKVTGDDPGVGLYFVPAAGQAESLAIPEQAIKMERPLAVNTASRIISIIPQLTSGEWKVVIKTQYTVGGSFLKEPRIIESPFTLTV